MGRKAGNEATGCSFNIWEFMEAVKIISYCLLQTPFCVFGVFLGNFLFKQAPCL
jgi:hypothetical protein